MIQARSTRRTKRGTRNSTTHTSHWVGWVNACWGSAISSCRKINSPTPRRSTRKTPISRKKIYVSSGSFRWSIRPGRLCQTRWANAAARASKSSWCVSSKSPRHIFINSKYFEYHKSNMKGKKKYSEINHSSKSLLYISFISHVK